MKLFLLGGFLGSGKTTAIGQACKILKNKTRVAVITNDQGAQLVDTAFVQSLQVPSREVINGCFCCRFEDLDNGIRSLCHEEKPEVVFAESVGSCTDLIATVVNPLMQAHPSLEIVVSIFADARLLLHRIVQKDSLFDEEVEYIYTNQLDEADLLVVNKTDLLTEKEQEMLRDNLSQRYPKKMLLFQNSLEEESISQWIATMEGFQLTQNRKTLQIDYDTYAEGEARLGWLDEELEIITPGQRAVEVAFVLMNKIHEAVRARRYPVGHLKFMVNDGMHKRKISFVAKHQDTENLYPFRSNAGRCILLVNARIQADPDALKCLVADAIDKLKKENDCKVVQRKMLAFRPGYPKPLHRMVSI